MEVRFQVSHPIHGTELHIFPSRDHADAFFSEMVSYHPLKEVTGDVDPRELRGVVVHEAMEVVQ